MNALIQKTFHDKFIMKRHTPKDMQKMKSVVTFLCESYKEKMISDDIFEEFIKILLSSYIEKSAGERILFNNLSSTQGQRIIN